MLRLDTRYIFYQNECFIPLNFADCLKNPTHKRDYCG
jgi:hypothetical protein